MSLKFCTYCGYPLPRGVKFCPNCGKPASASNVNNNDAIGNDEQKTHQRIDASQAKETLGNYANQARTKLDNLSGSEMSNEATNYGQWFIKTLKQPFTMMQHPKYGGLISIIVFYLMFYFTSLSSIKELFLKQVSTIMAPLFDDSGNTSISYIMGKLVNASGYAKGMGALAGSWRLVIFSITPITIILLYLSVHIFRRNTDWNLTTLNEFSQRFNLAIPAIVLAYVFKLLNFPAISCTIIFIITCWHLIALIATIKIYQYEYRLNYLVISGIAIILFCLGIGVCGSSALTPNKKVLKDEVSEIQNDSGDSSNFNWNFAINPNSSSNSNNTDDDGD